MDDMLKLITHTRGGDRPTYPWEDVLQGRSNIVSWWRITKTDIYIIGRIV